MTKGLNPVTCALRTVAEHIGEKILFTVLAKLLTKKVLRKLLDGILDYLEEKAELTETSVDDALLYRLREILGIPDDDD